MHYIFLLLHMYVEIISNLSIWFLGELNRVFLIFFRNEELEWSRKKENERRVKFLKDYT